MNIKQTGKQKNERVKPTVALDCNKNLSVVDGGNQVLRKIHSMARYQRLYKKGFFYCPDRILLSSYVVFKTIYMDRAYRVFKQKVAEEIIEKNIPKIKTQ